MKVEEIESWLFPLVERIHNITHSYMNKQIYAADCKNKQIVEIKKTAKLISKAIDNQIAATPELPELLEACKTARNYLQFNKGNASPIYDQLTQAIAKAEEI